MVRDAGFLPRPGDPDRAPVEAVEARDAARGVSEGELGGGREVRAKAVDEERRCLRTRREAGTERDQENPEFQAHTEQSSRERCVVRKRALFAFTRSSASVALRGGRETATSDRKSTRLNSRHL